MLITANGIRINVMERGNGEAIFFLHGANCDATMWEPQMVRFAGEYRCLAWDARSHGRSDNTLGLHTMEMFSRDLFDVLRALGIERAHIVGLSLGTLIAQQFALDHPDMTQSLSLLCPFSHSDDVPWIRQAAEAIGGVNAQEAVAMYLSIMLSPATHEHHPEVGEHLGRLLSQLDPDLQTRLAQPMLSIDFVERLGTMNIPTLVAYGEDDQLMTPRAVVERTAAAISGASLHAIPHASLVVNMENPDYVNELLAKHFANA